MTLSIIIVNYNVYNELVNSLNSINKNISDIEYEIIVVDNNSLNRDIDRITSEYPDVKYIKLQENIGFAKANNLAAARATGRNLFFLNPDTVLINNFSEIIKYLEENPVAGACAPMLLNNDFSYQSSTGQKMGLKYDFLEASNLIDVSRKFQKNKYVKNISTVFEVGWVSAACMFVNGEIFDSVNGFTEAYFLNYEDVDLCFKLNMAGYKNYYFPEFKCIHLDHKSFDTDFELLVYSRYVSRLEFAKLNYNFIEGAISRIFHIIGLLNRVIWVNFLYSGNERNSRRLGYIKSLKQYLGLK